MERRLQSERKLQQALVGEAEESNLLWKTNTKKKYCFETVSWCSYPRQDEIPKGLIQESSQCKKVQVRTKGHDVLIPPRRRDARSIKQGRKHVSFSEALLTARLMRGQITGGPAQKPVFEERVTSYLHGLPWGRLRTYCLPGKKTVD